MGMSTAFIIGLLQQIDPSVRKVQALVLAPSRVLAQHIRKVVLSLTEHTKVKCHVCMGGSLAVEDIRVFQNETPHVVVGTLGRVRDMIQRRALGSAAIRMFCVDDADEMLSLGLKEQIYDVVQFLSRNCQVGLLSATMPPEVLEMKEKFMRTPVSIIVKQEPLQGIRQFYIAVERRSGSLTPCAISMRHARSPRRLSTRTRGERSSGWRRTWASVSSLHACSTVTWIKRIMIP